MSGSRPGKWPPDWPDVTDPAVLDAIAAVPRHRFVPPQFWDDAYVDGPLPIGLGQTISQPYIVALMTQALGLTPHSRALEIGTGSGYQAAILAHITPNVWSVEVLPELAEQAQARLDDLGYAVHVKVGDGWQGWPEYAPYDAIIVAAAGPEVPPALVLQLAEGGRLVAPVGEDVSEQVLWAVDKAPGGAIRARKLADVRFVPLVRATPGGGQEDPAYADIRRQLQETVRGRRWHFPPDPH